MGTEYEFDIVSYPISEVKFSPEEVVERVLSRLHEDSYNIAFNNCAHFACWCITGKRKSAQVRSVANTTTAVTVSYQALTAYKKSTATLQTAKLVAAVAGSTAATTGLSGTTMGVVAGSTAGAIGAAGFAAVGMVGLAAAPVVVPIVAVAAAGAAIGGLIGKLFD